MVSKLYLHNERFLLLKLKYRYNYFLFSFFLLYHVVIIELFFIDQFVDIFYFFDEKYCESHIFDFVSFIPNPIRLKIFERTSTT